MIGDNIRRIRISRNMTQGELAEAVHVKRQTVSSWEVNRTEPNMGIIELLAVALRCRKSDLVGEHAYVPTNGQPEWYIDDETARLAQDIYDNQDLRVLMMASAELPPESVKALAEIAKRMKGTNPDG